MFVTSVCTQCGGRLICVAVRAITTVSVKMISALFTTVEFLQLNEILNTNQYLASATTLVLLVIQMFKHPLVIIKCMRYVLPYLGVSTHVCPSAS